MLGMTEVELIQEIEREFQFDHALRNKYINDQPSLSPSNAILRLATSIAKAIEKNNQKIEAQLRER